MSVVGASKALVRRALGAPGIREGLRWFINEPSMPREWRDLAHRKLAKRARFGDKVFTYTTATGARLRFLHTGTPNYLYWRNEYEPETTSLFALLAKRSNIILDIGAADGLYAILGAAANPSARIFAFEPGEKAARTARRNIELNLPLTQHVELHTMALGDRNAQATLYVAGETGGTSSLNPEFRAERELETVTVRSGDSFLSDSFVDGLDLIKVDTESTEPEVLRGLKSSLDRYHPDVICEVLSGRTERALEEILGPLGYNFYWITNAGLARQNKLTGDPTYRAGNFLFSVRPESDLRAAIAE